MRILDFHTHAFPDSLAERAMQALTEDSGEFKPENDGTVAGLLGLMDRHGVEKAVVASIATKPAQAAKILEWSLEIRSERLVPFASVHPDSPSVAEEIRQAQDAGLKGLKLHPLYQGFRVDEERCFPLYEAVQDSGLPLLVHAGEDIAFPGADEAAPRRFVPVLRNFPRLRLVLAHFGGWRTYGEFLETLAGSDVFIDTSFAAGFCAPAQRDAILKRHDTRRILFASDSPWGGLAAQIDYVRQMPVSDAVKERIFWDNGMELLGD